MFKARYEASIQQKPAEPMDNRVAPDYVQHGCGIIFDLRMCIASPSRCRRLPSDTRCLYYITIQDEMSLLHHNPTWYVFSTSKSETKCLYCITMRHEMSLPHHNATRDVFTTSQPDTRCLYYITIRDEMSLLRHNPTRDVFTTLPSDTGCFHHITNVLTDVRRSVWRQYSSWCWQRHHQDDWTGTSWTVVCLSYGTRPRANRRSPAQGLFGDKNQMGVKESHFLKLLICIFQCRFPRVWCIGFFFGIISGIEKHV